MIEKIKEHDVIDPKTGNVIGKIGCDLREIMDKLNEVIDAANELQTQVSILEEHAHPTAKTPDYDDTDDIAEVKNENVPRPIKLYVCADGSMYDNEDVAKSHAASIFNPLPAGATTTDQVYLEQDPYAEQRKWIGCVCRFWYDNPNDTLLDYLDKIQTGKNGVEYYAKESGDWFSHCEPVKPDDDIIYKGE